MTDTSVSNLLILKAEQRQLVWRFVLSFGVIAGTVAAATMVAHWMR
jgi:hypothetical protein